MLGVGHAEPEHSSSFEDRVAVLHQDTGRLPATVLVHAWREILDCLAQRAGCNRTRLRARTIRSLATAGVGSEPPGMAM